MEEGENKYFKLFLAGKVHEAKVEIDVVSSDLIRNLDWMRGNAVRGFVGNPVRDKVLPLVESVVVFRKDEGDGGREFAGFW